MGADQESKVHEKLPTRAEQRTKFRFPFFQSAKALAKSKGASSRSARHCRIGFPLHLKTLIRFVHEITSLQSALGPGFLISHNKTSARSIFVLPDT